MRCSRPHRSAGQGELEPPRVRRVVEPGWTHCPSFETFCASAQETERIFQRLRWHITDKVKKRRVARCGSTDPPFPRPRPRSCTLHLAPYIPSTSTHSQLSDFHFCNSALESWRVRASSQLSPRPLRLRRLCGSTSHATTSTGWRRSRTRPPRARTDASIATSNGHRQNCAP